MIQSVKFGRVLFRGIVFYMLPDKRKSRRSEMEGNKQ